MENSAANLLFTSTSRLTDDVAGRLVSARLSLHLLSSMLRFAALTFLLFGAVACGGQDAAVLDDIASTTTELESAAPVVSVPVSVRLCEDASDDSLGAAIEAGFEPLFDAAGEVVAIGPIVSGTVAASSIDEVEAADCVVSVERSDERIIIPAVTP